MKDSDAISSAAETTELNEQYDALRRAHCLSRLSTLDKRWLAQSLKFKKLLSSHPHHVGVGGVASDLQRAVETTILLSQPNISEADRARFDKELYPRTRSWVCGALSEKEMFKSTGNMAEKDDYSPVTYAMAIAIALDDKLFNAQRPNVLALAAVNAEQYEHGWWPKALGKRVQHVLEKRLAKELEPTKKILSREEMVEHIQDNLLDPIVDKKEHTYADSVKIRTISEAALRLGIVLDRSYFWHMRDMARDDAGMDLMVRDQMKKHDELRNKQKAGVLSWMRNRARGAKKNG